MSDMPKPEPFRRKFLGVYIAGGPRQNDGRKLVIRMIGPRDKVEDYELTREQALDAAREIITFVRNFA